MGYQWYAIDPDAVAFRLDSNADGWYFLGADGLRMPKVSPIEGRTPYIDGATLRGHYTAPRDVIVMMGLEAATKALLETALRTRQSNLSPHKIVDAATDWFSLRRVDLDGNIRQLDGLFVGSFDESPDGPLYARVPHVFRAFDPWWYDPTLYVESIAMPGGGGFSFAAPGLSFAAPGVSFASTTLDGRIYPNNIGDVPSWPTIRIMGPCDNPAIENETTGKTVAITQAQDANDYIEIDMDAGTVKWWDNSGGTLTSILANISAASEFWALARGVNTIHVTAAGAAGGSITASWYNRYLSV